MAKKEDWKIVAFLCLMLFLLDSSIFAGVIRYKLPKVETKVLEPFAKIDFKPINEGSAFARSGMWKNVFWTLNDSGGEAVLFPLNSSGKIIKPSWYKKYKGIKILGAFNVDWEAVCADGKGHLIISDAGNNNNYRRDLTLFWVPEPYPQEAIASHVLKKLMVYYPQQKKFPAKVKNFDSEAIVYYKGKIYIFTKNRSDTHSSLYRLDSEYLGRENPLTYISTFDTRSMVTDADISENKNKLAVLTYKYLWVFDIPSGSDNFFEGRPFFLPIEAGQCEGVSFEGRHIYITNEQRELFKVKLTDLIPLKRK